MKKNSNKKIVKLKTNQKNIYILFLILLALIIFLYILIKNNTEKNKFTDYNKELTKLVDKYYREKYLGKVNGLNTFNISLEDIINENYAVKDLKSHCKISSFGEVIIDNPGELNKDKVKYTIVPHYSCDK